MSSSEEIVRHAYDVAEQMDIAAWKACFAPDGLFIDNSIAHTYHAPDEVAEPVEHYGAAFSDMHRELYEVYPVSENLVVVQLALQGTHDGPLVLPQGVLPPTGKKMDSPTCDVFRLENGLIKKFDCYPSGTVILTQLGVIGNLADALQQPANA
jgi:ketosteroid isomerase-like protein